MNKANLEKFKMSKAQMNKVNGGMRCAITDREFGGTIFMDFEVWHKIFYVEYCSFCSIPMLHKKFDVGSVKIFITL